MNDITISNITKTAQSAYNVEFSSILTLSNLSYETSADGNTWNLPIVLPSVVSPQAISVIGLEDFFVRLSSDYISPPPPYLRIHSSAYTSTFN